MNCLEAQRSTKVGESTTNKLLSYQEFWRTPAIIMDNLQMLSLAHRDFATIGG